MGETLVDETRVWHVWADILEVTPLTFMAALGAAIASGEDHRAVFEKVDRPDWEAFRSQVTKQYGGFRSSDLYPDAIPALDAIRGAGYRIAIVANQPAERTAELRALGVDAEIVAMSDELGVHKPAPAFFSRALELMDASPSDVVYVGDRLDNDVLPSVAAGMHAVWIKRGPWAYLARQSVPEGVLLVGSLSELADRIGDWWPVGG